jgi:hypothetical protein
MASPCLAARNIGCMSLKNNPMTLLTCFVSISAMLVVHMAADKQFAVHARDRNDYFVPSADAVKLCSLGFDQFLADMYWLAFVQYCGEIDPRRGHEYRKNYDYVNLITDLDPHFLRPYWFGSWAIGYWQKRPDLADRIIQRGISNNPNEWEMPFLGGVNAYIFGDNAQKAAAYYRQAAKLPKAPEYLLRQAAILESPAHALVKRKHTLYILLDKATDDTARAAYRDELVLTLIKLYFSAPTERIREEVKLELAGFGEDVTKLPPVPKKDVAHP